MNSTQKFTQTLARTIIKVAGKRAALALAIGSTGALIVAASEIAVASLLQALLAVLGLLPEVTHPLAKQVQSLGPTFVVIALCTLAIGRGLCFIFVSSTAHIAEGLAINRLREILVRETIEPPVQKRSPSQTFFLMSEVFNATGRVILGIASVIPNTIVTLCLAAIMFYLLPKEAFLAFAGAALVALLIRFHHRHLRSVSHKAVNPTKLLIGGLDRVSKNWLFIKILRQERKEVGELAGLNINAQSFNINSSIHGVVAATLPPAMGLILIALLALFHADSETPDPATFIAFVYLFMRVVQGANVILSHWGMLLHHAPMYAKAVEFLEQSEEQAIEKADERLQYVRYLSAPRRPRKTTNLQQTAYSQKPPPNPPAIELRDVSFSYPKEVQKIFSDFNLKVEGGKTLGITGASGSGKSTLLALITGVVTTKTGSVSVAGSEPIEYFTNNLGCVGYVGPDPHIFEGSILDNLNYGQSFIFSEDDYLRSLELASFSVYEVSTKISSFLKHDASKLSAGQKQRLALARAFLGTPEVLILDEATANLDAKNEAKVRENLDMHFRGKSTILIASHSPTFTEGLDHILKL